MSGDEERDHLAALNWINRQINGFDGGDRAAVVRRLLAVDPEIAKGVAHVLAIGLVCHAGCPEKKRGRPPRTVFEDTVDAVRLHTIGPYIEAAEKSHRAHRVAEMQKCFNIKRSKVLALWAEWRRSQESKKIPRIFEDYFVDE